VTRGMGGETTRNLFRFALAMSHGRSHLQLRRQWCLPFFWAVYAVPV